MAENPECHFAWTALKGYHAAIAWNATDLSSYLLKGRCGDG